MQHKMIKTTRSDDLINSPPMIRLLTDEESGLSHRLFQNCETTSNSLGVDCVGRQLDVRGIFARGVFLAAQPFVEHPQTAMRARVQSIQLECTDKQLLRVFTV